MQFNPLWHEIRKLIICAVLVRSHVHRQQRRTDIPIFYRHFWFSYLFRQFVYSRRYTLSIDHLVLIKAFLFAADLTRVEFR